MAEHVWCASKSATLGCGDILWYAQSSGGLYLHRFLLSAPTGIGVDHRDGDGLNNRRSNLRLATQAQNNANQRKRTRPGLTSQFKGVSWRQDPSGWSAWIVHMGVGGGEQRCVGAFQTEMEAALAYDQAARDVFAEFARLNFPDGVSLAQGM